MDINKFKKMLEYMETQADLSLFQQEEDILSKEKGVRRRMSINILVSFIAALAVLGGFLAYVFRNFLPLNSVTDFLVLFGLVTGVMAKFGDVADFYQHKQQMIKDFNVVRKNHQERVDKLDAEAKAKAEAEAAKNPDTKEKLVN